MPVGYLVNTGDLLYGQCHRLVPRYILFLVSLFFFLSCFILDDDYLEKNIPPEAEELSFEVSYSEMVTEAPNRNKWKKSDIKKEDYALTVS